MLIIITMHRLPVYCTVLACVGLVSSVGGSPHRRLFFTAGNLLNCSDPLVASGA